MIYERRALASTDATAAESINPYLSNSPRSSLSSSEKAA